MTRLVPCTRDLSFDNPHRYRARLRSSNVCTLGDYFSRLVRIDTPTSSPQRQLILVRRCASLPLVQLPDCFGHLKKLENIQLSHNHLRSLPSSFASLSGLRQLVLSHNQFANIPDAILKLTNLQLLDLSANHIAQIPDQAETLQVDELNLNDNRVRHPPILRATSTSVLCASARKNLRSTPSVSSTENTSSRSQQSRSRRDPERSPTELDRLVDLLRWQSIRREGLPRHRRIRSGNAAWTEPFLSLHRSSRLVHATLHGQPSKT